MPGIQGRRIAARGLAPRYNTFIAQVMARLYADFSPVLAKHGVDMAPVFDRFQAAVQFSGGNSCVAGLLLTVNGACNVHPTAAGHQLIASIIAEMVPPR